MDKFFELTVIQVERDRLGVWTEVRKLFAVRQGFSGKSKCAAYKHWNGFFVLAESSPNTYLLMYGVPKRS